jgi:hypothetical protein
VSPHSHPQTADAAASDPTLALSCAICAALKETALGRQLDVSDLYAAAERVTNRLLAGSGLATFDRRITNHARIWEKTQHLDTLLEACATFNLDNSSEHHVENTLKMALEHLAAIRVELWGDGMRPHDA